MNLLLGFLLLLTHIVVAAPCSESSTSPCTPSEEEKREILDAIQDGRDAKQAQKEAAKRTEELDDTQILEKYEALNNQLTARQEMRAAYTEAIRLTENYYHLTPPTAHGTVAIPGGPGTNPGKDWAAGMDANWAPEFYDGSEVYAAVQGSDGKTHYLGGSTQAGATLPDGRVLISPFYLEAALTDEDPGELAFAIHHEAHHFSELITMGWDTLETSETRAYRAGLAVADIFGLDKMQLESASGKTITMKEWVAEQAGDFLRASKVNHTPAFPTPETEKELRAKFEEYESEEARLVREIDELKPQAEAEKERRQTAKRRQILDNYIASVRNCAMEPILDSETGFTTGFLIKNEVNFTFTEPATLGQARAAILIARACWAAQYNSRDAGPCAAGLEPMQQNWDKAEFKHGLELDADAGAYDGCLSSIRSTPSAPKDFDELFQRAQWYWADWRVAATRQMIETSREYAKQQEEASRRERYADRQREHSDHSDSYDLTPAYEALERARRSHF